MKERLNCFDIRSDAAYSYDQRRRSSLTRAASESNVSRPLIRLESSLFTLVALLLASPCLAVNYGPSPYLSFADSPFSGGAFSWFYLEDFEDGLFNTPGVTVDNGLVSTTGFFSNDSVDADDGAIDGNGVAGNNMYSLQGQNFVNSFQFIFNAVVLGQLPTHAGVVWTDGSPGGLVTFEAFDQNGISLGSVSANLGDGSFFGTTAEDRFFGASNPGGISRIFITDNGTPNDVDLDHLQYGYVPEPAAFVSALLAMCGLKVLRRRF